jgi:uncharacterized protein (DUF362 family)
MEIPEPRRVAVARVEPQYPAHPPFHPDRLYPESPWPEVGGEPNPAYRGVREALRLLGADAGRFGTKDWNPLAAWVKPGHRVLVKPNLVKETHPRDPQGWRYVMTHGSVLRAILDYLHLALKGKGEIWIADAPQTDSSWDGIVRVLALDELVAFYGSRGVHVELVDLRQQEWTHRDGVVLSRHARPGDPRGYVAFDLGAHSEFHDHGGATRYFGADYASAEVNAHHSGGRHEYLLAGSAIRADVFVNVPKLKTHKKAGITCSLKNLVGINGDKNWLPHHTEGDPRSGGDEFPRMTAWRSLERASVRRMRRLALALPGIGPRIMLGAKQAGKIAFGDTEEVVRSGNWFGNDTLWRMCLDLNKLLLYGEADGTLRAATDGRRPYLSIVDGVIGGEGRGPMNPDPVRSGVVLAGVDPAAVDWVAALLMGFDPLRLPIVERAFRTRGLPVTDLTPADVRVVSADPRWDRRAAEIDPATLFRFRPHFGWEGHVEPAWRSRPSSP